MAPRRVGRGMAPRARRYTGALQACPTFFTALAERLVELSTILIKYAFKIASLFWARRFYSVVPWA
jgi:hypothetical protein